MADDDYAAMLGTLKGFGGKFDEFTTIVCAREKKLGELEPQVKQLQEKVEELEEEVEYTHDQIGKLNSKLKVRPCTPWAASSPLHHG